MRTILAASAILRECQKLGALRRELDCRVAEASIEHRSPDLKHTMSASR